MPWKTDDIKQQRCEFIKEFLRKKTSVAALCRQWRLSRKTAYKWIARFKERGRWGLADRLRVAHSVHNRPSQSWLSRLKRWRRKHPSWGAPKLRWELGRRFGFKGLPSEAGIGRWLKKWKFSKRRRRAAHKGPVIERPTLTQAVKPNDVWTVDFKGPFRTGDGTRVDPLTIRDLASRYILAVVLLGGTGVEESQRALRRVFQRYGLPLIIRADNGSPFGATGALGLTRLSAWWVKLGIRVEFIDPGRPDQNGAHEQFHRVYKEEAAHPPARTPKAQQRRSERWRKHYNAERPHEGIKMRVPAHLYRKSRRRMPSGSKAWKYPKGWESRLVKGKGMISWNGLGRFVGEAFERERVGLRRVQPEVWEVYYGPLLVGELWDSETGGIRAAWYRKGTERHRPKSKPHRGSTTARYARLRSAAMPLASSKVLPMR